ncbi:MAG: DUF1501 domain-containing protein, partial [Planctomycetaceae bacterium]|nr:DUF1501 domain-containing protein [Planctomycetaceae bacterium]
MTISSSESRAGFPCGRLQNLTSRRQWLGRAGGGLGMLALADLLQQNQSLADQLEGTIPANGTDGNNVVFTQNPLSVRRGHFPAKAKAIIWLFMEGAPSAVDLFDPKPELNRNDGKRIDIQVFFGDPGPLMKSPFQFKQYGECGQWVCEHYTHVAEHVDDLAFIKSCYSESDNHVPALYQINTGLPRPGFPSAGSWITYGLGSSNQNLPGYVVLENRQGVKGGPLNWSNGFLPSSYQGTLFRTRGNPVLNLNRLPQLTETDQRSQLDLMGKLNRLHAEQHPGEADLAARIQSFELAYRMQSEAMSAVDLKQETADTHRLYGIDRPESSSYGTKCLMARRLVEAGVRFVQVYSDGEWDAHNNLTKNHTEHCQETDVPIAGLLTDLKQRGLWDDVLVIWGGEF